ncbi:hypothetical protein [uncultured Roseovarius sp.]|mgnify:CR=1 FL=1|uniref:hypothetical protein n=1 Tax=uncultured Roseovarius sp. TaxID=293344 RepID=UPI0025E11001|nr:hypothetical protein [uncultured Roseovarius sp.]
MNSQSPSYSIPCLAQIKAQASDRDFAELFRNQYVLDPHSNVRFPGWSSKSLNGWTLHHGFALRVLEILDKNKTQVGFLLGHALYADSGLVRDCLTITSGIEDAGFWPSVEAQISELSGRYLAIIVTPRFQRILPDPVSDIPVIYNPEMSRVGSSLGLVLTRPIRRNPLFDPRNVLTGKQTLSFGQTLDNEVFRCLPNHFLDLSDFSSHRFWPREDTVLTVAPRRVRRNIVEITERLSAHMASWISEFKCAMPVTGGKDSRALLACSQEHLGEITQFFAHRFNNNTRRDAITGQQIMAELGYPFEHYFRRDASLRQRADMRLKMGWSGYRGELGALHALESYPEDYIILRGNIMELIRANQYRGDRLHGEVHIAHGIRRTGAPEGEVHREIGKWQDLYMAWYDTLPSAAQARPYDFGFIEHLLPNTQASYFTAMHRGPFINPFNDRRLIQLAISIPPDIRYRKNLYEEIILRRAPDLMNIPFN